MSRAVIRTIAIALLAIPAFGATFVGASLVWAQVTQPASADPTFAVSPVPAGILAYGLVSLMGAVGVWLDYGWVKPVVVVSQGLLAVGLLAFSVLVAADWSVLIVAAIAGGAAVCVGWLAVTAGRA
jgi:uncharacterized membrane protein (DUF2068 family)